MQSLERYSDYKNGMEKTAYTVKINAFEGPLDLLLTLIESRRLHINDISLSAVADDYLIYVQSQGELPIAETANFILVASTLLLIKSKSLLPVLELTEEEQGSIGDLERRLKLHKLFKDISILVQSRFGREGLFPRSPTHTELPIFSPDKKMTLPALSQSILVVVARLPRKVFMPKAIVETIMTLEEMIDRLAGRVTSALQTNFRDFAGVGRAKRGEIILSFLALLELVKRGIVSVTQDEHFKDISIKSDSVGTPHYH